jgi:hypothetical protein
LSAFSFRHRSYDRSTPQASLARRWLGLLVLPGRVWGSLLLLLLTVPPAQSGGPKYVAGTTYFEPSVLGQPIHWSGGQLNYYVDQGPLTSSISNQQAKAMVNAAAALWSAVPTAAVRLTDKGSLIEDVSGANIAVTNGRITAPSDVTAAAAAYPVAVILDADGSVIDAVYGAGASLPTSCQSNGVLTWLDNINSDATAVHAIILMNGLCATSSALLEMMSFELERAFGRVLGLDYAQVNPTALTGEVPGGTAGWPVMEPLSGVCSEAGGACIPDSTVLRYDDVAALSRIYPVTAQNIANFTAKQVTSPNTVSIQGTISFRNGEGMQGVNVVARPLDVNGDPMYEYTVTFVSGGYFNGNHGSAVTGYTDANGNLLSMWGSNSATLQGYFDLSAMPLPPGMTSASYQVTFEPLNPLYILEDSVGPYFEGQTTPSGTLQPITVTGLAAGSSQTINVNVADSAIGSEQAAIGTTAEPRPMPASGMWTGRLSQVGQTDWFTFPVRGNRTFTVITQALDARGAPTETKSMPAIGLWDGFDAVGSPAEGTGPGLNGGATGETFLRVGAGGDVLVRMAIADQRGDGRPDYPYNGWLLYADTVEPARLPAAGGTIVIHGMGFRLADTVLVNGQTAMVLSVSPNEITAIAPPAAAGVKGSVDVEVDELPTFYAAAIISGGLSYDAGSGDALTLVTAPMNTVPVGKPIPFTVTALGPDLAPAGGVTILYTVTAGTAKLACGVPACSVTATGDGRASMDVTAVDGTWSIVTASLTNGSSLQAQFAGGTPSVLAALSPLQSVAAETTVTWNVQALALSNGAPSSGQAVVWQASATGLTVVGSAAPTNAAGLTTQTLTVGPLAEGQLVSVSACLNGTTECVTFSALGARAEYAVLEAVSATVQSLSDEGTPAPIVLRLLDMNGNPMAAGTVTLYQALYAWAAPCSARSVCPPSTLLATQTATATSALDGTVTFTPATLPGVATSLIGLAASGDTSSLNIAIEQHP